MSKSIGTVQQNESVEEGARLVIVHRVDDGYVYQMYKDDHQGDDLHMSGLFWVYNVCVKQIQCDRGVEADIGEADIAQRHSDGD